MTNETQKQCRCEKASCGCAKATTERCVCGHRCACKSSCQCGAGCACNATKQGVASKARGRRLRLPFRLGDQEAAALLA